MGHETFRTTLWFLFQLIQTLHAVDKDDPYSGHQFSFSLAPEAASGSNFSIQDNKGKWASYLPFIHTPTKLDLSFHPYLFPSQLTQCTTYHTHNSLFCFLLPDNSAGILTRKNGYNRHEMSTYLLPVVISDNDYPVQSSTGTVTVRVCACDHHGNMQSCQAEALIHPTGLSTGALVAILLCIVILLGKLLLPASYLPLVRGTHCYCDTLDFSASPSKAYSLI